MKPQDKPAKTEAKISGDQWRAGFARSADVLSKMLTKAERTGRKEGGLTADELRAKVSKFRNFATASDADLQSHFNNILARCTGK